MHKYTDTDRYNRVKKTSTIHYNMEVNKILAEIVDDFPDNPERMKYFYDKFKIPDGGESIYPKGKKIIASMCIHVPIELVIALDAIPVRICSGAYSADAAGSDLLPAKTCPMVKSTMGALFLDMLPGNAKPDLVINPTTCDQKKKIGEMGEEVNKEFYTLEVPPTKDSEEARQYWQRVIKKLIKKLESVTGNKLTRKKLKRSIHAVANAQSEFRRFMSLRKGSPVIYGKDALLVTNAYFFDDIHSWTDNLKKLNDELEERKKNELTVSGKKAPRILLTGSPSIFPNMRTPIIVEIMGGVIVYEEFCSSSRMLYDTVAVDEWFLYDMIPGIADRYLKPSTCPNFTPNDDRIRKIMKAMKEYNVDGVVYQTFTGCQLYDLESRRISRQLEDAGFPVLNIEVDYNPEDSGQLNTRLEAFLESIKDNNRKN
ncbi:MAG: double-cubane-cluster-containing anaerobic reductase [Bacteroidota bacterium]